ncbi:TPA: hypothetical protein MYK65_000283 [Klebsiella variicola subsp. variicola]|nr:hypothetical protein [Klebsiella variicola subsp. variicola]
MNGSFELLKMLPSFHAGILAIISAVIISWFFYAYPKLLESKRNLYELLSTSKNDFLPEIKNDNSSEPITELTFDDIYNALNYQNFIPENRGNYGESLINNSHRYLIFMANITNKPPFISWWTETKESEKSNNYDLHHDITNQKISVLLDACDLILRTYDHKGDELKKLFSKAEEAHKEIRIKPLIEAHNALLKRLNEAETNLKDDLPQFYKMRDMQIAYSLEDIKRADSDEAGLNLIPLYETIVQRFYNLKNNTIPKIVNYQAEINYLEDILKQKGNIKNALQVIFFNLIAGVVLPFYLIAIQSEEIQWNNTIVCWFIYILTTITVAPYLAVCWKAINFIKK